MSAAVLPTPAAGVRLRPLDHNAVQLRGGFWGRRVEVNRDRTIPHGTRQLEAAGNLANFEAAIAGGEYRAGRDDGGMAFPFVDSDVYKWLEAAGWELGRAPDGELAASADRMIDLVERAQRDDGYVNTYVELATPGREFQDLAWGHELYTMGHLIQAGVAWSRAVGDDRLLAVSRRAADRIDAELGPDGRDGIDGHPEIEMALVELFRTTGEERHLQLARHLLEQRGRRLLGVDRFGTGYWQDHAPVRSAPTPTGHAVRQLYLDCGAVDVAVETGDAELLAAVVGRWREMLATRAYLTGGVGSHHRDEAFGQRFELPPDRAYAETCAAIAVVMLAWRLLLATGEAEYADHLERTLLNGVLPGVSLAGDTFFYVNPLQRRGDHDGSGHGAATYERAPWFPCACCPPNLMRTLATVEQLIATADAGGVQLHQFASGEVRASVGDEQIALAVRTEYPWDGTVTIELSAAPSSSARLALRVPSWCGSARLTVAGEEVPVAADDGYVRLERTWSAGDRVELQLDMPARITLPDPRIDAVRGCAAIERGPLVYAFEEVDLQGGASLDEAELLTDRPLRVVDASDLGPEARAVQAEVQLRPAADHRWPYPPAAEHAGAASASATATATAVPYFAWANRGRGAMRVWMPVARAGA